MKNPRFHWLRAALVLLAAGLAFSPACYATPGEDASELATQFARLSKAALLAERGNPAGFAQLRESRAAFTAKLQALRTGGHYGLCTPIGLSTGLKTRLTYIADTWAQFDRAAGALADNEETLRKVAAAVKQINASEAALTQLTEQLHALTLQANRGPREISVAGQLVVLQLRLSRNATYMLTSDTIDPEIAFLLGKDTNTFRDLAKGLQTGSDALRLVAADGEQLSKVTEVTTKFQDDLQAISVITGNLRQLITAKSAAQQISEGGEGFFRELMELQRQIDAAAIC
jgi:twitching motility protein PilJ